MSNLSIQNLFGPVPSDAAARGTRSDGGRDQRDAAQAFNEVMQKHTARAPERSPERAPERTREPSAERSPDRSPERSPDRSNAAPAVRQPENTSDASARGNAPAQRATDAAAQGNSAPVKRPAGNAQAKEGEAQDDTGPDTATGDLFADLNLALSKAAAPSSEDTAAAKAAADPAATGTAAQPGQPNAAAALAATHAGSTDATAHAEGNAPRDAQNAAAVIEGTANGKTGNAAKKAVDPNAVSAAHDKGGADKTQAKGMEPLLALASTAQANTTSSHSENAPLSLSAALANPPVHAAHGLASTLAPTTTFSIAHAQVKTGVGAYGFAEDFSQRVVMLANQRVQSAEIALTPSDLGPVSVSLEMRGQEASLVFGAAQTATRAAIEDALPRLREMFQAQGLHLVDAQVSTQLSQHGQREAYAQSQGQGQAGGGGHAHSGRGNAPAGIAGMGAAGDASSSTRVIAHSNRLIDVHV